MNNDKPSSYWIDAEGSKQLPIMRAQGEGQHLEFMREFPKQVHELAKEIAGFASSNTGTILLGISNEGDCIGLSSVSTAAERDALLRRIEGICSGAVKPSITPSAKFAEESGRTVLVLIIPKGSQPVYYANNIPYVRHLTSARPAEPHEVIELVRGTINPSIEEIPDKRVQFLADIMRSLVAVRIFAEESHERAHNPWLEMWRAQFADVATRLREAAAQDIAVRERLTTSLLDTAEALDRVAKLTLHLGSGTELEQATKNAFDKTEAILKRIAPEVSSFVDATQLMDQLGVIHRQLAILETQAERVRTDGNLEEIQEQASEMGRKILFTVQYGLDRLAPDLPEALANVGHRLHLAETQRVYLDGGVSTERIIGEIKSAISDYDQAVNTILSR